MRVLLATFPWKRGTERLSLGTSDPYPSRGSFPRSRWEVCAASMLTASFFSFKYLPSTRWHLIILKSPDVVSARACSVSFRQVGSNNTALVVVAAAVTERLGWRNPRSRLPALLGRPCPPFPRLRGRQRGGSRRGEPGAPRERPPTAGRPGSARRPGPHGQRLGPEEGRPGPDASGRGPRNAPGRRGSDGPGAPADEPRRESGRPSPSPEPRLS